MAIRNINGNASGLNLTSGLAPINDFALTGICRVSQANVGGEAFICLLSAAGRYLGLTYDVNAGPSVAVRFSWDGGWTDFAPTFGPLNQYFAFGINCSGGGPNVGLLNVMLSTGPTAFPQNFAFLPGGTVWTPTSLRLMFDTTLNRGIHGSIQNIKYGDGGLTAQEMHDEAWSLTTVYPAKWTPVITEMVTGDLTAQREAFGVVGAADLVVEPGHFVDTGGSPGTVTVATATINGDDLTVAGTITSASLTREVIVELVSGSVIISQQPAILSGLSWTVTFSFVPAAIYSVRARLVDAFGAVTSTFGSTVEFIGLSGTDTLPSTYPHTAISAIPSSLTMPAGGTAIVRAVNQAGAPIPGAVVTSLATSGLPIANTPDLTDLNGNLVVTASAAGTASFVISILNQAGSTLSATVPVTVGVGSVAIITVTPSSASLNAGQTQQFTSVIVGGGTTTWSVVSGLGSIDASGIYTAPLVATQAVIRGARTSDPSMFDESLVTVAAGQAATIGGVFLTTPNQFASPGATVSWRIRIAVNGEAFAGAVVSPTANVPGVMTFNVSPTTAADGTTTVTATVAESSATDIVVAVALNVAAGSLLMALNAIVTVSENQFGYVEIRGRRYPRPYPQKT